MNVFVLNVKKSEFFFKTFWDIQNNSCIFALAFENLDVEYIKKKYNEDRLSKIRRRSTYYTKRLSGI